jgi:hypothetical protein
MSIRSRKSEDHLHTDVILSKITEYDIFMYYCPSFKKFGKKFCSELRSDKNPTAHIISWNNKLLYKDFGNSEHTFDCFDYVKEKYSCSFTSALRIIDCDFNLGLSARKEAIQFTMGCMAYRQKSPALQLHKPVIIRKKKRNWNNEDANFWRKYLISKKILTIFAVEPINYYWVNENRFSCKSITYAFKFNNRYKIYSPYEDKNKWLSNTKKTDIQGYSQLPDKGNKLIITSSLKDVMCLYVAGYNAIALQSEMQMPEEKLISELRNRFNTIEILYDNDFDKVNNPGQTMAKKICNLYGFNNICIPDEFGCKDPSDLVKHIGNLNELKTLLK